MLKYYGKVRKSMLEKLEQVEARYEELNKLMK